MFKTTTVADPRSNPEVPNGRHPVTVHAPTTHYCHFIGEIKIVDDDDADDIAARASRPSVIELPSVRAVPAETIYATSA